MARRCPGRGLCALALVALVLALAASPAQGAANVTDKVLPISNYEFIFTPVRCYRPRASCRRVVKFYNSIDTLPKDWPPSDVTPGEYRLTIVGIAADAAKTRIPLENEVVAFGKPLPSPPPRPPRREKSPPPAPKRRPGGKGGIGSGGGGVLPFTPGSILPPTVSTGCTGTVCNFTPQNLKIDPQAFNWLPPFLRFLNPNDMIEAFLYQAQRSVCSLFLSGTTIRSGIIPYIPTQMNIVAGWFGGLPLTSNTQYIAGALITATPVKFTVDSSGVTPSMGKGVVFAINPCTEEYHFGFVDITTPPVAISALLIEVSASPSTLSVANKGTMASNHEAIAMTQPFWVGVGRSLENRVISRGHLYLAGNIIIEPIGTEGVLSKVVEVAVIGAGKALVSWDPDTSRGGDFELMATLDVFPEITIFDTVTISFPVAATSQMYTGITDTFRFRMRTRISPYDPARVAQDMAFTAVLRSIDGMPSFITTALGKMFGGSSSDSRCAGMPGLSFREFDVFADGTGAFGIRLFICASPGSFGFVGSRVLSVLSAAGFPTSLGTDIAFSSGNGSPFAVSIGTFNLYFCANNGDCPSGQFCGVAICLNSGVFGQVIKAVTDAFNEVDEATKALYRDTMTAAQDVPDLLKNLGDSAKKVGDAICAQTNCKSNFRDAVNSLNSVAQQVVSVVTNTAKKAVNKVKKFFRG